MMGNGGQSSLVGHSFPSLVLGLSLDPRLTARPFPRAVSPLASRHSSLCLSPSFSVFLSLSLCVCLYFSLSVPLCLRLSLAAFFNFPISIWRHGAARGRLARKMSSWSRLSSRNGATCPADGRLAGFLRTMMSLKSRSLFVLRCGRIGLANRLPQ